MLSLFGKFVRKLRIDNGELLKDMAEKLGVTPSYLSAVENSKRNVPQNWQSIISEQYSLDETQESELANAIQESQLAMKFDLNKYNNADKSLMMAFARELKDLDEDNKLKIREILRNHKNGGTQ